MNNAKKLFFVLMLASLLVLSLAMSVSANAPPPAEHLRVLLSNVPDDAVYADLLIKLGKDDSNYVDFQTTAVSATVTEASEIVRYAEDGFCSFTFHYKDAKSNIKIEHSYDDYCVVFCDGSKHQEYLTQYEDLCRNYRDVKVALLDEEFNIISVSKAVQLPKESSALNFDGVIHFDCSNGRLEYDTSINPYFAVFGGFFSILIMLMSIGTETVTALLFKFRGKQVLTVLIVNICSQIVMRALYLVLPFTYLLETIVLEAFVYTSEFFIYKKHFKDAATSKLLWYTVTANTLSLLFGILLDCYILV